MKELIMILLGVCLCVGLLCSVFGRRKKTPSNQVINTPQAALERLIKGNENYVDAQKSMGDVSKERRLQTAKNGQKPFAVVVSCADSRVPPELVFSAGIGDLFVIRTAGNVVGDFELGSIEYGAKSLGAKIVIVMGHSNCGAVEAAIAGQSEGHIQAIIDEMKPVLNGEVDAATCEERNIHHSADKIMQSEVIKELVENQTIKVVPAKYDLESGSVHFYKE